MKYLKLLVLVAAASLASLTLAGGAMATYATSPKSTSYTGKVSAQVEKHLLLTGAFGTFGSITCEESTLEFNIETHGTSESHRLEGNISKLALSKCTGGEPTTPVASPGRLIIHTATAGSVTGDGTVTSSGATIIWHKMAVGKCVFVTNGTDIGRLTGSTTTKGKATLDIGGSIPTDGANPFCGSSATWEGAYVVNVPAYLDVD